MDYVDFLISACLRHLPYFIERERSSRNYPPMFIGPQTDVKPPQITPQKIKTVIKSTSRSSQCRMTRHMQLSLPLDQATARRRSRRHQGRVTDWAAEVRSTVRLAGSVSTLKSEPHTSVEMLISLPI